MKNQHRIQIGRIVLSGLLLAAGMLTSGIFSMCFLLISYAVAGYSTVFAALRTIASGRIFDENLLMTIATIGALILKQWDEAVAVMLFYLVGQLFESYAVGKSRDSISQLMNMHPESANIFRDGELVKVDPSQVEIGEIIVVKTGEMIPLDGIIVDGETTVDTSALTGESMPESKKVGDEVPNGIVNLSGGIHIKVTEKFENSTVSKILDLVEGSGNRKARVEKFISKFAKYYTPAVVAAAIGLALIPPIFFGQTYGVWVYRALLFLVISCPCALVISIPMSFFGGVGASSKIGVLVKGGNYLEALGLVDTLICDKTGTITKGTFELVSVNGPSDMLDFVAHAEIYSNHPIAVSVKKSFNERPDSSRVTFNKDLPGQGVEAVVDGRNVKVLNEKTSLSMLEGNPPATFYPEDKNVTTSHVFIDNAYYGNFSVADTLKDDSEEAIRLLKESGITNTVMLTGDRADVANSVGDAVGIDTVLSQLMPGDKVDAMEEILAGSEGMVAFVGDGINDAPSIARADVGIAMGGLGSRAAVEAADIVIMDDSLSKLVVARKIARKTVSICRQNIVFALGVKAIMLLLGAMGIATMWMAIFADVGVSIIAILNSMRSLAVKK